jgi:hypothetical protein
MAMSQARVLRQARRSVRWQSTKGRIIHSGWAPVTVTNRFYEEQPAIRYNYRVGDVEYQGRTVHIGTGRVHLYGLGRFAELERYPLDAEVTVWYDPAMPTQATLERGTTVATYLWLFVALGFVALGVSVTLRWYVAG